MTGCLSLARTRRPRYAPDVNRETFDIALSAQEERPEEQKAEFLRQEALALVALREISDRMYADVMARLGRGTEDGRK